MATAQAKNRINVSFSTEETRALSRISKRDQLPVATKVAELVRFALGLEEDQYFSNISDERIEQNTRAHVSHADAWK
jgi:hypothetical protein